MNKADIINQVSDAIGPVISRQECATVVEVCLSAIKYALASGDRVEVRGFGSFSVVERRARMARNPRTGTPVPIPPRRVVTFKPAKALREKVAELPTTEPDYGLNETATRRV